MSFGFLEVPKTVESIAWWVAGVLGLSLGVHRFWKSKTKTDNFILIHSEINERLTELRVSSNSMRVSVMQFHNGEYYMDGISMRKFSVSHESSYKGYTSQALKFKNTLCSLFIPLVTKVLENRPLIYSVDALPENSFTKHFFEDEFISHFSCLPLKNKNTNVGFILIQWHKDYQPTLAQEETFMKHFEEMRGSIELQLSYQKN
jgi:hypothetical protein